MDGIHQPRQPNPKKISTTTALSPFALLALAACGGGGGGGGGGTSTVSGTSAPSFSNAVSGNVIKGPLTGAIVFLDRNDNGTLDEDEESVSTGPGGAYSLQIVGDIPNGAQVVVITSGAKDESTGKTLEADVVLKAPANSKVITPLTTIAGAAGLTTAEAAEAFGLGEDVDIFEFNPFVEKDSADQARQDAAAKLEALAVVATKNIVEVAKASNGGTVTSSSLTEAVNAAAKALNASVDSEPSVTLDTLASNDFLNDMIDEVKANTNSSNWDINDVNTTEIANTLASAKVVEEKGLNDPESLDALKSISKGASVLSVVVLEAGAENALAPILLFYQMFDEWVENSYTGTQLSMVNDDGVFKLQAVVDGVTLPGEIVLTGRDLDAADPTSGVVTRIDFYAPFSSEAVMYMDLPEDATASDVKAVLEGWYKYEYGGGDYFSLFPPSGDPENDQFVTIVAEKSSSKGAIIDTELFGGADKIVSGSQYDDIIALYDQKVSKNFDGVDITPTVGTTRVYSLDGSDRILPLLFDKDALLGEVTVKDFRIGSDVIDLSVAGLSYENIISEAYTDNDGVKGVKLWFDFDRDGEISTSDRGEVLAENSRGSIFLEGVTKAKWDAQIAADPSKIVVEGASNLTANWDAILDFDGDSSLLDDDTITPKYTPDETDAFVIRYLNSMGYDLEVSSDGKTATQNIYERTVEKPAGDPSIIIGTAKLYGSGLTIDPETGRFVSGFVDRAEILTDSGEIAFDWEGFATADEFNEGRFLDGIRGHVEIAAWMSGFAGDYLGDLADNRYGDWDDAQFETVFKTNLEKFGITFSNDNKVYYDDVEVSRFDFNSGNSANVIQQFASWLDNQSDTGSVADNVRASENWTVKLSKGLERYEGGYLLDGVSMGIDELVFGGSINDTPFNDAIELGSAGKDTVDLSSGGSDIIWLEDFYTASYTEGVSETNTTLSSKIYHVEDVLDLIPENYIDRDEIIGFSFENDAGKADYLTTVNLPDTKADFFYDNNGNGLKDAEDPWTVWWGMRQSFDIDGQNGVTYQEGKVWPFSIQEVSVAYSDLDGDGMEDDVLLTLQNVSEWYEPEGTSVGGWSVNADYEIAFIDPVGLDGVSGNQLEAVVSKHIYMGFTNNSISSDGESYFADPVSLYALDQWKEYLVDKVGLSLVDTQTSGSTLTYEGKFLANPNDLVYDDLQEFVMVYDLVKSEIYEYAYEGSKSISDADGANDILYLTTRDADGLRYFGNSYVDSGDLILTSYQDNSKALTIENAFSTKGRVETVKFIAANDEFDPHEMRISSLDDEFTGENIAYFGTQSDDTLVMNDGYNEAFLGEGNDTVTMGDGSGYEVGGYVFGEAGDDVITGNSGNDFIRGGDGADILKGVAGDDTIYGDNGSDVIDGGAGSDKLTGGDGADIFVVRSSDSGSDTILDFATGDKLGLVDGLEPGDISTQVVDGSTQVLSGDQLLVTLDSYTLQLTEDVDYVSDIL